MPALTKPNCKETELQCCTLKNTSINNKLQTSKQKHKQQTSTTCNQMLNSTTTQNNFHSAGQHLSPTTCTTGPHYYQHKHTILQRETAIKIGPIISSAHHHTNNQLHANPTLHHCIQHTTKEKPQLRLALSQQCTPCSIALNTPPYRENTQLRLALSSAVHTTLQTSNFMSTPHCNIARTYSIKRQNIQ